MKAQKAQEDVLVVCAGCNGFDEVNVSVCVLSALAAGIVRVAPHDNFTDLVQDTMSLLKVPAALLTAFRGEFALQQVQEIHSTLMEVNKAIRCLLTPTTENVPVPALDQHLRDIIAGVSDGRKAV